MAQAGSEEVSRSSIFKVALASLIGTSIEWYDFFLYGTAAALVFNRLFFPEVDPLIGTLAAFATFGVGFVARPIGGIVFGHLGDKLGRKAMLVTTLLIMGIATVLIGLLPTFETIGIWAAILLVVLRLAQGFGVGGEWGGAVLMAVEHSPEGRRGFYGSWPQMGVPIGLLLATGVFSIFSNITTDEQFLAWGWRIPFLLSIVLIAVGLFIRLAIAESPAFQQLQRMQERAQEEREQEEAGQESQVEEGETPHRFPIIDVLRYQPKNVLVAMGMRMAENGSFYIFSVFVLTYTTQELGLPRNVILNGVLIAAALEIFAIPAFGALSDKLGRRPVYMFGALFSLLFAFPYFWLTDTRSTTLIWLAIVLALVVGHGAMYGPQASFFSELFSTGVRYSGASIGYQLASVIAGGFSPFIATALLAWAGGNAWPVALYMVVLAAITAIAVYFAAETYQSDISGVSAQQRSLVEES